MKHTKSTLALAVIAAAGLTACGGDSGGGGNNADNGNGDNGDGNGTGQVGSIQGDVTNLDGRGDWGSIVLSGYGNINIAGASDNNQALTEAVPDGVERYYGGTDNNDSNGSIEYAVVAETGTAFRQDEEVQGVTIEASGSGTKLDHIQVINSDDDGIEWFGGAADASNVVIQAATDDSLDQDQGWQGTVKTALVIQGPNSGNRGMETDNNGDDFGATPKTKPVLTNVTILGHRGNESDLTAGALHREGYGGKVFRSVYTDNTSSVAGGGSSVTSEFQEGCLDVDDEVDGDMEYGDVLFNCAAGAVSGEDGDGFQGTFQSSAEGDFTVDNDLTIDNQTLAIGTDETADGDSKGPFTTDSGNQVTANDWHGAVDPSAGAPDTIPDNGGPFWDGWTYKSSDLSTNLPGNVQDFHPLQAEIEAGDITPADTSSAEECNANVGNGDITGLEYGGQTDVFGESFPVCVIDDGDLDGDFALSNDHVYVLNETVQVGNGDVESASDPSTVANNTLTIDAGTQIFGNSNAQASLVITRGSEIDVNGTAEQPVIFGGADFR
ncbi:hypothetical protein [Vreelandella utahensis]|uniref:hypothetical protein n=1 Tax=Vreelandella halophila TaxID=86177 RepID=UPI000985CB5C|nr:hypothetical protein [Halomonas utahensis]